MRRAMMSPYQAIVEAAKQGKGARLTPAECKQMSIDTAIEERARLDDEENYKPED